MTEIDRQADLIRMTRYYLDRSYYPSPGREEYYAAFVMACEFLGLSPGSGTAQEAWQRIVERHLGETGSGGEAGPGGKGDPGGEPGSGDEGGSGGG